MVFTSDASINAGNIRRRSNLSFISVLFCRNKGTDDKHPTEFAYVACAFMLASLVKARLNVFDIYFSSWIPEISYVFRSKMKKVRFFFFFASKILTAQNSTCWYFLVSLL